MEQGSTHPEELEATGHLGAFLDPYKADQGSLIQRGHRRLWKRRGVVVATIIRNVNKNVDSKSKL